MKRTSIAGLSLSAAALVGIAFHEGYTDRAIIPVKGDRPTVGFGSTFRDDGSPVRMGDTITPPQAIKRTLAHIQRDETALKQCVTGPLTQKEYDVLVDFSYQYGTTTACRSSIVRNINAGRYQEACDAYAKYRFVAGRDCSLPENRRVCGGVWTRSLARQADCHAAGAGVAS
jgi:lysozyme